MRRPLLILGLAVTLLAGCAQPATPVVTPSPPTQAPPVELIATTTASGTLWAPVDLPTGRRHVWLERIDRTAAILADTDLSPLDDDWDARVVVELPSTTTDFTRLAGSDSGEAAAVTRCDAIGSRITINPRLGSAEPAYLDALLLHEAVHAATGAACRLTPLWIEEGLAEWVTVQHSPDAADTNRQWLDHALATDGVPSGLPPDDAFQGTAAQLSAAYALAVFAVDTTVRKLGQPAAMAYFAAPDDPTTAKVTVWYLDGLAARLPTATASASR